MEIHYFSDMMFVDRFVDFQGTQNYNCQFCKSFYYNSDKKYFQENFVFLA